MRRIWQRQVILRTPWINLLGYSPRSIYMRCLVSPQKAESPWGKRPWTDSGFGCGVLGKAAGSFASVLLPWITGLCSSTLCTLLPTFHTALTKEVCIHRPISAHIPSLRITLCHNLHPDLIWVNWGLLKSTLCWSSPFLTAIKPVSYIPANHLLKGLLNPRCWSQLCPVQLLPLLLNCCVMSRWWLCTQLLQIYVLSKEARSRHRRSWAFWHNQKLFMKLLAILNSNLYWLPP